MFWEKEEKKKRKEKRKKKKSSYRLSLSYRTIVLKEYDFKIPTYFLKNKIKCMLLYTKITINVNFGLIVILVYKNMYLISF